MVSTEQDVVDYDDDVVVGGQQQGEHEWSRGVK